MVVVRQKPKLRCECGKIVSPGSVFCPHCRAVINRKNAKTMKREGRNCRKILRSQRRGRKK